MIFTFCLFAFLKMATVECMFIYRYPMNVDLEEVYNLTEHFQDGYEKRILEKQLLYCPMVPLCNNLTRRDSYPNGTSSFVESCCFPCSCQQNGITNNEQCPNTDVKLSTHRNTCIYPQYRHYDRTQIFSKHSYYMISSCASTFNDISIINQCTTEQGKLDPFDIYLYRPVSITNSNLLYKNKYCALCNNHIMAEINSWSAILTCAGFDLSGTITFSRNMLKEIAKSDKCNILFQGQNMTSEPTKCDWGIYTTCNQTGRWDVYDKFIEDACNSYTSVYRANYRNIFCFLCNSNQSLYMGCNLLDLYGKEKNVPFGSFASLLNFREDDQASINQQCAENEVFDSHEDKCREVICPERHYYDKQNNKCERIYQNVKNVFYQVYYKITVEQEKVDQITVEPEQVACSIDCMIYDYLRVEEGICLYFERVLGDVQCCYLSNWYHPKEIKNFTHHEYIIGVNYLVTNLHNQTMYVESMSFSFVEIFKNKSLALEPISKKALDLVPDLTEFDYFNNNLYDASYYDYPIYTDEDYCYGDYETINVVDNYFCPRIKLQTNEVQLSTSNLTIMNKNLSFEINSVIQMEDGFLICLDDRMIAKSGRDEPRSHTRKNDIERILSFICSITSITLLTMTIIVYLLLKELRTLPGLQQLMLSFHLLVAHALYLFGMNATYSNALCVAIGLLTHYFWLGSVMWMHICTLDIFRIFFYQLNTQSNSNRMKLFKRYLLYSVSVCCFMLTINVVYFFVSDNTTLGYLGYGGDRCYITKAAMVLYTFAIPVGILILLNMILFCFVIIRIETAQQVASETKIDRPMLIIYTKISIVTGVTWIFGFLHQWTLIDALSYIFIILNASQGLFIFLSFGCNGFVRSRIRAKYFGQKTHSSHESDMTKDTDISKTTRHEPK